jgi:hypothetical protein
MDYKYIEQLLERYWECQTTLEEESILRKFFAQSDIPARLLPYADLFRAEADMAGEGLGEDFDKKVLKAIDQSDVDPTATVKPVRLTLGQRLAPFYRAAAVVAVVLTIGMAAQQGFQRTADEEVPTLAATPNEAAGSDTIHLFTDMPEPMPQTEAALPTTQTDTLSAKN